MKRFAYIPVLAVLLAIAVLGPLVALSAHAATVPSRSCTERVSNSVRLLPQPGYYQVTITHACGSTGVTPKVRCWNSSTFVEKYGSKIRTQGVKSKASCPSGHPRLTKAWVIIGRRAPQRIFP